MMKQLLKIWVLCCLLVIAGSCVEEGEVPMHFAPCVRVDSAQDITRSSARLQGSIELQGAGTVNEVGFCWGVTPQLEDVRPCDFEDLRNISASLAGLSAGTTYYFCLEAGNSIHKVRSEVRQFSTLPNKRPVMGTLKRMNQGPLSITLQSEWLDDGGEKILQTGFYYWKTGSEQVEKLPAACKERVFSARIAGLELDTEYEAVAFAVNKLGETRSEVLSFRTGESVIVEQAGTLPEAIGEEEKYLFTALNISGPLNGTDFRLLRDMMGRNVYGNRTPGVLNRLDLTDASLVEGGCSYDASRYMVAEVVTTGLFADCSALKVIKLPESVVRMEENALAHCTGLESLYIPDHVDVIYPSVGCSSLTSLSVSALNKNFSVAGGALYNLEQTELIWYPAGRKENAVKLPATVASIGNDAFREALVRTVGLPEQLTKLGRGAFAQSALDSIVLPDKLQEIPVACFQDCLHLTSLTLGADVRLISEYAFDGCSALKELHVKARDLPPYWILEDSDRMKQQRAACTLYVPRGCRGLYASHPLWGGFKRIVEE